MEELLELRQSISSGDYVKALSIVDEMEAMSKEDKLEKIYSYVIILPRKAVNAGSVFTRRSTVHFCI